jgi:hypothetical protein
MEPWQVEQAQEALRVMYQECLPLPWARPWPMQADTAAIARGFLPRESFVLNKPELAVKSPVDVGI